jgi:hypothetical protein
MPPPKHTKKPKKKPGETKYAYLGRCLDWHLEVANGEIAYSLERDESGIHARRVAALHAADAGTHLHNAHTLWKMRCKSYAEAKDRGKEVPKPGTWIALVSGKVTYSLRTAYRYQAYGRHRKSLEPLLMDKGVTVRKLTAAVRQIEDPVGTRKPGGKGGHNKGGADGKAPVRLSPSDRERAEKELCKWLCETVKRWPPYVIEHFASSCELHGDDAFLPGLLARVAAEFGEYAYWYDRFQKAEMEARRKHPGGDYFTLSDAAQEAVSDFLRTELWPAMKPRLDHLTPYVAGLLDDLLDGQRWLTQTDLTLLGLASGRLDQDPYWWETPEQTEEREARETEFIRRVARAVNENRKPKRRKVKIKCE